MRDITITLTDDELQRLRDARFGTEDAVADLIIRVLAAVSPSPHAALRSAFLDVVSLLCPLALVETLADRLVHLVVLHGLLPEVSS